MLSTSRVYNKHRYPDSFDVLCRILQGFCKRLKGSLK